MKAFGAKLFVIALVCTGVVFLFLLYSHRYSEKILGPSTKHQIESSFANAVSKSYDLYLIGNSRFYRGINPEKFTHTTYNFSYDGDTYLQTFYKLKFLEQKNIPIKHVAVTTDYFSFSLLADNSNGNYFTYFPDTYKAVCSGNLVHLPVFKESRSNAQKNTWPFFRQMDLMNESFNTWITKNVSHSTVPFIKGLLSENPNKPVHKLNGQYIVKTEASENDFIERSSDVHAPLKHYLDSIVELCKKHKANLFLIMMPTRKNELKNYTSDFMAEMMTFYRKMNAPKQHVFFLDYQNDTMFKTSSFADITHLNEAGADLFSEKLNRDILSLTSLDGL